MENESLLLGDLIESETLFPQKLINPSMLGLRLFSFIQVKDFLQEWHQPVNNFYWIYRNSFSPELLNYFERRYPNQTLLKMEDLVSPRGLPVAMCPFGDLETEDFQSLEIRLNTNIRNLGFLKCLIHLQNHDRRITLDDDVMSLVVTRLFYMIPTKRSEDDLFLDLKEGALEI